MPTKPPETPQPPSWDPYAGNILVQGLNPIPSPTEALQKLICIPRMPSNVATIPCHIRMHYLMDVRELHIPPLIDRQLLQSVDLMVRQGYKTRNPVRADTWALLNGEMRPRIVVQPEALGGSVEGISGVGKTQGCLRSLCALGPQTLHHEKFPRVAGPFIQVVWLSVEVPSSGRSIDFARSLMTAWDEATGGNRFSDWLAKDKISSGMRALYEWRQVAMSHFLGILHLDEVQNFFRLAPLEKRRQLKKDPTHAPELKCVEDEILKWLLSLINTGRIPLLVSGTPDGIGALSKRLATQERINTLGTHAFERLSDPSDSAYFSSFFETLSRYQYVAKPLEFNRDVEREIIDLTGGVQRIIIALWIAAHRTAFERGGDSLEIRDFRQAACTWLAPLAKAVAALKSGDPRALAQYDDIVRSDPDFWKNFWSSVMDNGHEWA